MTDVPSTSDHVGANQMIEVTGPVMVRFRSAEREGIAADSKHLDVYIDVTRILVLRGLGEGSRVILQGNALVDLADSCDEVLERLRRTMEQML